MTRKGGQGSSHARTDSLASTSSSNRAANSIDPQRLSQTSHASSSSSSRYNGIHASTTATRLHMLNPGMHKKPATSLPPTAADHADAVEDADEDVLPQPQAAEMVLEEEEHDEHGQRGQGSPEQRDDAHCSFCLLAEFDIDRGSTLTHQYPAPIGHDEHMLAELMLPDGVHARTEDWTVFFLPRTQADRASGGQQSQSRGKGKARNDLTYVLSLVRTKHDNSVRRGALVKAIAIGTRHPFIHAFRPALLLAIDEYFLDPSRAVLERLYDCINLIDLSLMPVLTFNEKIILRASERRDMFEERFPFVQQVSALGATEHMQRQQSASTAGTQSHHPSETEASSYSHDESLPPGGVKQPLHGNAGDSNNSNTLGQARSRLMQKTSSASLRQGNGSTASSAPGLVGGPSSGRRLPSASNAAMQSFVEGIPASRQASTATFASHDAGSGGYGSDQKRHDTHFWETKAAYGKSAEVFFRIPTDAFDQEIGEYSLTHLIETFGNSTPSGPQHPHLHSSGPYTPSIILLFNAVATGKRIIFLGHNQPAMQVASHVLSLCALSTGCGGAWQGVVGRCFPYANLGMLDELEEIPGYIAGVTNPRFEELRAWDILCNTETGKITIAKDIEPASPLRPQSERAMTGTYSSGSIGSTSATDFESRQNGRGISESEQSHQPSVSSHTRAQRSMPTIDARSDATDVVFMEEVQAAIAARYGEKHLRLRFYDYALNFIRLAARHEEYYYELTALAPSSQPFLNGQLGSGLMLADRENDVRSITGNAMRIEGWRATDSYRDLRNGKTRVLASADAIGFDLECQVARLRRARHLPSNECELIYIRIARSIKTPEQVTELLSLLPPHLGSLLPLSAGLFHPSSPVRNATVEILSRFSSHGAGRKIIQSLSLYHRLAFARLLHQRQEMLKRAHTTSASVGSASDTMASPARTGPTPPSKSPYVRALSAGLNAPSGIPTEFGGLTPAAFTPGDGAISTSSVNNIVG